MCPACQPPPIRDRKLNHDTLAMARVFQQTVRAFSGFGQGSPAPRDQVAPAGAREGGRNLAALGLRRKSGIQPCRLNQTTMFAKLCAPLLFTSGRPMTRFGHCNQKHARVLPSALPDCWKSMARWRAPARPSLCSSGRRNEKPQPGSALARGCSQAECSAFFLASGLDGEAERQVRLGGRCHPHPYNSNGRKNARIAF